MVSAQTSTANGHTFRLHALDIATGAEKFGGPVVLQASLPGTGDGGIHRLPHHLLRPARRASARQRQRLHRLRRLRCAGGSSPTAPQRCPRWASSPPAPTSTAKAPTPAPAASGWAAVAPSPTAPATSTSSPATVRGMGQTAYGDSVLKFGPTPRSLEDYFTPYDYQYMDCNDDDLGSGGLLLIPGTTELLAGGKTSTMYLVNSSNMGHEHANDAGATQTLVWGQGLSNGATYSATCTDSAGTETANVTSYEIFGTSAYLQQLHLPRRHARSNPPLPAASGSSSTPEPSLPAPTQPPTFSWAHAAPRPSSPPTAPPAASSG